MAHEIGSSGVKIIMKTTFKLHLACLALVFLSFTSPSMADMEKRIAFVVGNSAYQAGQLATSANDAGLIAQILEAAGFDVTGARDHGALRLFRAGGGRAASSPSGGAGRRDAVAAPPRAWRAGRLCRRDRARYAARL
jgi:hypothetical protein